MQSLAAVGVMEGEIIKGVVKGKRREPPKLVLLLVKIYDEFSQACGGRARETMLIASVVSVLDTSSQLTALKLYSFGMETNFIALLLSVCTRLLTLRV